MKWSEIYFKLKRHQCIFKTRQQMGQAQVSNQLLELSPNLKHRKPGNGSVESTVLTHVQITANPQLSASGSDPLKAAPNGPDLRRSTHRFLCHLLDSGAVLFPPHQARQLSKDQTAPSPQNNGNRHCVASTPWTAGAEETLDLRPTNKVLHHYLLPLKSQKLRV